MKKLFVLLIALLVSFSLTACNDNAAKDEVEPEIAGVKTKITGVVGEEINLLEGVTATDNVDGNITSSIVVTTMPNMTVTNGKVTPTLPGDYEVQYKVTDKAGNEGEAFTTLNVTKPLAEKVVYKEFNFETPEVKGWNLFVKTDGGEANAATLGLHKGNLRVSITESNNESWHIKFENSEFATVAGTDYTVIYNVVSDKAGVIKTNDWSVEHQLEVGVAKKVEYKFTATGETTYLCLDLGMLGAPANLDITSIEVIAKVGQDVFTDVTPEFTYNTEGVATGAFDNNATGELTTTADSATLNITRGSDENNCWQSKLFVKPGFDLEANTKYKISVDVYSQNGHGFEICYNNGDAEKGIGALYGARVEAGETKTFDITVSKDSPKDNLILLFQLGTLDQPQGSDVITVSNLKIEVVTGDKVEEKETISFTPVGFGTFNDPATAAGNLYIENGKLVYEMTQIGLVDWHNKMYVERLTLAEDKIYTISITAKADKEISCAFFLAVLGGEWDPRISAEVTFTTTETTIELTLDKPFATEMAFELLWQFGSAENAELGGAVIEFSNITIYSQDVQ